MTVKKTEAPVTKANAALDEGAVATASLIGSVGAGAEQANLPAATKFDPSGAPVQIVPDVDLSHPAVDNDPRAGTTIAQNKIDFNDPTLSGPEAVAKMLNDQGIDTKTEGVK